MNAIVYQAIKGIEESSGSGKTRNLINEKISVLAENIEETSKNQNFYKLPLDLVLGVVGKVDFSETNKYSSIIERIIENTTKQYPKNSSLLLHHIKCKYCNFSLDECVNLLQTFSTCELCNKLGEIFRENDVSYDYEFALTQKEKEIERLKQQLKQQKQHHYFPPVTSKPKDYEPDLTKAVAEGKLSSVQYAIEKKGVDKEAKYLFGQTLLHIACKYGKLNIVMYLIEQQNADPSAKDKIGWTPLHIACWHDKLQIAKYLIEEHNADVESRNNSGETPLHSACKHGNLDIVKYLCQLNANKDAKNEYGWTPLYFASKHGFFSTVQYLISQGADIHIRSNNGETAYDIAKNDSIRNLFV